MHSSTSPSERRDFEWLRRHIEGAAKEVQSWPEWKRRSSTLARDEQTVREK